MSLLEDIRKSLEDRGETIGAGGSECKNWRTAHGHCHACPSEIGCVRLAVLSAVIVGAVPNKEGLLQGILDATTVGEILDYIKGGKK